jgi:hypothetical protein
LSVPPYGGRLNFRSQWAALPFIWQAVPLVALKQPVVALRNTRKSPKWTFGRPEREGTLPLRCVGQKGCGPHRSARRQINLRRPSANPSPIPARGSRIQRCRLS